MMNKKTLFAVVTMLMAVPAFAQEAATAAAPATTAAAASTLGFVAIGIGLMLGLAVLGGTLGQGRAASAALDGIARNPAAANKFTTPLILSLALMESLVLFAFLIALFLQGPIGKALETIK